MNKEALLFCVLLVLLISKIEGHSLRLAPRRFMSSGRSYHDSHSSDGINHGSKSEDEEIRPNRKGNLIKNRCRHPRSKRDVPPMEMIVKDLEVEVDGIPQNRFAKIPARRLRLSKKNHAKFTQNPLPNKAYSSVSTPVALQRRSNNNISTSSSRVPRMKIKVFLDNKNKSKEKIKKTLKPPMRVSITEAEEEVESSRRSHDAAFSIIG